MASSPVLIQVATPGPPGPAGPAGANGAAGYSPQYVVGPGVPSAGVGLKGDMYINSTTSDVWGPKIDNTTWPNTPACNIRGTTGAPGYSPLYIVAAGAPTGAVGNNGDMYINSTTSDVYGPKASGAWGGIVCNIKGATGSTGPQGPPGVAYTPRGAWSGATTYAQGDMVSDLNIAYISLQSSNVNHVPASNPTWWQAIAAGGTQTPWASDIDGNGKILFKVANIGIGTATPTNAKLEVVAGSMPVGVYPPAGAGAFRIATDPWSSAPSLLMGVDGSLVASWIQATQAGFAANPLLLNPIGGNVGIGCKAPASLLTLLQPTLPTTIAGANQIAIGEPTNNSDYRLSLGYFTDGSFTRGCIQAKHSGPALGSLCLQPEGGRVSVGAFANPQTLLHMAQTAPGGVGPVLMLENSTGQLHDACAIQFKDANLRSELRFAVDNPPYGGDMIFFSGSAGTTEIFRATSGGNVGIGTSAPTAKLHVVDQMRFTNATNVAGFDIGLLAGAGDAGAYIYQRANAGLFFGVNNAMAVTIVPSGRVGIGTYAPVGQLAINPPTTPTGVANALQITVGEQGSNANYYMSLGYMYDGANWGGSIQALATGAPCNLVLQGLGGKVAVGATASTGKFAIIDGSRPYDHALAGDGHFKLGLGPAATDEALLFGVHAGDYSWIQAMKAGTASRNLALNPGGSNVGIGNVSPAHALDVSGNVNCTGQFLQNGAPLSFAPASHTHDAAAIVSGVLATARLGAGAANSSVFLRGDGNWAAVPAGGGPTTFTAGGKVINTVYQNQTGKPIWVSVIVSFSSNNTQVAQCDTANPPTTQVSNVTAASGPHTLSFIVLPNYFYRLLGAANVTLAAWYEWN